MKRLFIIIFMGAVFLSACGTSRWIKTPVLEQKNLTVSLEHRMEKDRILEQNYHHPYKINPLTLKKILTDLVYVEESGFLESQNKHSVFQDIEIARLTSAMTDALALATPNQRICFTSFNKSKRLLFKTRRKTEGVIFLGPDSRLNIAFALINVEIDPNTANEMADSLTRVDPLKIKSSETTLVPALFYAKHHTVESGKSYPIWIVAELDKLQETLKAEPQPPDQKPDQIDQKSRPCSSLKVTTDTGKMRAKPLVQQPVQTTDDPQERIRNNLTYLKELFETGLINKQEYEAKKREILDDIK